MLYLITSLFFSIIGVIGGILLSKWEILKDNFFKIELFNIVNFISTVIISLIVAYFVTRKVHYGVKQKEFIIRIVDEFKQIIIEIFDLGNLYIDKMDKNTQRQILRKFNYASIQLDLIIKFSDELDLKTFNSCKEEFKSSFISYKAALTDTPFGSGKKYKEEQIYNFVDKYEEIRTLLNKVSFNMYK